MDCFARLDIDTVHLEENLITESVRAAVLGIRRHPAEDFYDLSLSASLLKY